MAEYIDKEKLLLSIHKAYCEECQLPFSSYCIACWVDDVRLEIADAPTADVVEVVRCKDCKHHVAGYCTRDINGRTNMFRMGNDDFCSYGAKMDGKDGKI